MNRVAAVIVTYNRREKLLGCIDAVMKQAGDVHPDIIVVDNNSTDGTEGMIKEYISGAERDGKSCRIIYHNLRYNSGGAGGFCFGMRRAVEAGYDYVWLMDDDCIPADNALEEFLKFDAVYKKSHAADGGADALNGGSFAAGYGFLSGRVLWRDGSLCRMNIQRRTMFRSIRNMTEKPEKIVMASFASLFIPAHIAADIGLPIRQFFIWTDDWEYTRRISRKYPCWLVPGSITVHDTEVNEGADISTAADERIDRFRYLYRNDVYLYRREGVKGCAYEAARLAYHAAKIALSGRSRRDKLRRIGIMIRGTADGIGFCPAPDRACTAADPAAADDA